MQQSSRIQTLDGTVLFFVLIWQPKASLLIKINLLIRFTSGMKYYFGFLLDHFFRSFLWPSFAEITEKKLEKLFAQI